MIGIAWKLLVNIVGLWVLLLAFDMATHGFETIALSFLVFIYLSIQGFMIIWGRSQLANFQLQFRWAKRAQLTDKYDEEELEEVIQKFRKDQPQYWINIAAMTLMYLIAVIELLGSI